MSRYAILDLISIRRPPARSVLVLALIAGAALLGALAAPVQASTSWAAPYDSTHFDVHDCSPVAETGSCAASPTASAASGAVAVSSSMTSPQGGSAPWGASTSGHAQVVTPAIHLAQPTPELDFTVRIHLNEASVTLRRSRLIDLGEGSLGTIGRAEEDRLLSSTDNVGRVNVSAVAVHSEDKYCGGGTSGIVLSNRRSGTVTISDRDVLIPLHASCAGKDLPPGDLRVRAGVSTSLWQHETWGDASASVDAVVEAVSMN